jgi:hypothetical protein
MPTPYRWRLAPRPVNFNRVEQNQSSLDERSLTQRSRGKIIRLSKPRIRSQAIRFGEGSDPALLPFDRRRQPSASGRGNLFQTGTVRSRHPAEGKDGKIS